MAKTALPDGARFCQLRMAVPPDNTLAGYTEAPVRST